MEGEAKGEHLIFSIDKNGYILELKRLKCIFGLKFRIVKHIISKLTWEIPVLNDDDKELLVNCYTKNDCVVTIKQLNYVNDLHSTDVLRQAIRTLPIKYTQQVGRILFPNQKVQGSITNWPRIKRNGLGKQHSVNTFVL